MTDTNFDALMNATCNVYEKGAGAANNYGQPDQTLTKVLSNWPCRQSTTKAGKEYMSGKEYAVNIYNIFMRPPTKDDNNNPFQLTTHHWLIVTIPSTGVELKLNVQAVDDPSGMGHHLQVRGLQVIA